MSSEQSDFEDFTHHLNKQETENPCLVIDEFFRFSTLPESRKLLWDWLRVMIGEDFDQLEDGDQSKMLKFFENLEKLVEAAHILKLKYTSV